MAGVRLAPPAGVWTSESIEQLAYFAALLGGEGARARQTAHLVGAGAGTAAARSCLDAGAPLQLFIDAPRRAAFRCACRLDGAPLKGDDGAALALVDPEDATALRETAERFSSIAREAS